MCINVIDLYKRGWGNKDFFKKIDILFTEWPYPDLTNAPAIENQQQNESISQNFFLLSSWRQSQ